MGQAKTAAILGAGVGGSPGGERGGRCLGEIESLDPSTCGVRAGGTDLSADAVIVALGADRSPVVASWSLPPRPHTNAPPPPMRRRC
jgi:hypothetical protein